MLTVLTKHLTILLNQLNKEKKGIDIMVQNKMMAYGFVHPENDRDLPTFEKREVTTPQPKNREILVEVKAVSVNPTDLATRSMKDETDTSFTILGRDAAGIVAAVGEDVELFEVGDEVYYPSSPKFNGTEADYHIIDERMVGLKPNNLSFAEAAALPLTAVTSYEVLHDRLDLFNSGQKPADTSLLIFGAAGGVGSIITQLALDYGFDVIGTASRDESQQYLKDLGVATIVDHSEPISEQLEELGYKNVDAILLAAKSDENIAEASKIIKPQGNIATLLPLSNKLPGRLFSKSVQVSFELMYTRSLYETADWIKQHEYLNELREKVEDGQVVSTINTHFKKMDETTLTEAYELLQTGHTLGKIVLGHTKA